MRGSAFGVAAMMLTVGCVPWARVGDDPAGDAGILDVARPVDHLASDHGMDAPRDLPDVSDMTVDAPVTESAVDAVTVTAPDLGADVQTADLPTTDMGCNPSELRCDGVCVDVSRDIDHCGTCTTACPAPTLAVPTCTGGHCGAVCVAGWGDCDGDLTNGCETNVNNAHEHCGSCGHACDGVSFCSVGVCRPCGADRVLCGSGCANVQADDGNCGACGNVCPRGATCAGGVCTVCPEGMRPVPAGTFSMGSTLQPEAQPVHSVTLTTFCMDTTEVTVGAYRACVTAGRCGLPIGGLNCNWLLPGVDNHPVNCTTLDDTTTYCAWRGARLPTEAQWEYAARGTDGRIYPWGDDDPSGRANYGASGTVPVASYPEGVSPFGLFDMAGNVAERVADRYGTYPSTAVTDPTGAASGDAWVNRGGPFGTTYANEVTTYRRSYTARSTSRGAGLGFRCAQAP